MNDLGIDIDAVVREVLAQLASGVDATPVVSPAPTPEPKAMIPEPTRQPKPKSSRELVLANTVVTLSDIADRLTGVRKVTVSAGAVVTPSVRDELRRRRVTLYRAVKENLITSDTGQILLMATGSRFNADPLVRMLEGDGLAVELRRANCLIAATGELASEIAGGECSAVLTTRHTAAALCLANRHQGVRAIGSSDPATVVGDAEDIGANLLVVDPVRIALQPMKQMIGRFVALGPGICPEVFREPLG